MPTKRKRQQNTCTCEAYTFPHRPGGGNCKILDGSLYYCSYCLNTSYGKLLDEGIGAYEYWGDKGVHHDYTLVSECCGETLLHCSTNEEVSMYEWKRHAELVGFGDC